MGGSGGSTAGTSGDGWGAGVGGLATMTTAGLGSASGDGACGNDGATRSATLNASHQCLYPSNQRACGAAAACISACPPG